MTLQQFEDKLKEYFTDTYRRSAPQSKTQFVVWDTYGRNSLQADDRNQLDCPKVQIDVIDQRPDSPIVDSICAALWEMDLAYDVAGEGYDPDYNRYRTTLTLVVV